MKILKMNGYPITNIYDYHKYFNVYDILKHNKEFLVFISTNFANLSKTFSYCYAMAYTAIENEVPTFMREHIYDKKSDINFEICNWENFWDNPFGFCQSCSPSSELVELSKVIAKQYSLRNKDIIFKKAMIISITAFIFLNDKNIGTVMDLEKAKKCFLGKKTEENKNPFEVYLEDDMSEGIQSIYLEPSAKSYICLPYEESEEVKKIKTFRIAASRKIHSLSNRNVKIYVKDELITIPSGDHIYVNAVNGKVVKVLEKSQMKKEHYLKNTGEDKDVLVFDHEDNVIHDFFGNEYISSFDFSEMDHSVVYLKNLKLCLDLCSSPAFTEQMSEFSELKFVEVKIKNRNFYLLGMNGELFSNDSRCSKEHNVCSIDEVLRRFE